MFIFAYVVEQDEVVVMSAFYRDAEETAQKNAAYFPDKYIYFFGEIIMENI